MKELFKKHDWENWGEVISNKNNLEQQDMLRDTMSFLFGYTQQINNYIVFLALDDSLEVDKDFKKQYLNYISNMKKQKYKALDIIDFILYYVADISQFNLDENHIKTINEIVVDCYNHAYTMGWFKEWKKAKKLEKLQNLT